WHVRGVSSGEKGVHQGAPDAESLIFRKDADRPHGNDRVGGDGRPARRDVADGPDLFQCRERQLGNSVARLPQRLEQTDLQRDGLRVLRPRKSCRVNVPNRVVVVGPVSSNDHRLILASPRAASAARARANTAREERVSEGEMTRYLISFDDGAMTFPEEELPDVAEAAQAVAQEAQDPGGWVFGGGAEGQEEGTA